MMTINFVLDTALCVAVLILIAYGLLDLWRKHKEPETRQPLYKVHKPRCISCMAELGRCGHCNNDDRFICPNSCPGYKCYQPHKGEKT